MYGYIGWIALFVVAAILTTVALAIIVGVLSVVYLVASFVISLIKERVKP